MMKNKLRACFFAALALFCAITTGCSSREFAPVELSIFAATDRHEETEKFEAVLQSARSNAPADIDFILMGGDYVGGGMPPKPAGDGSDTPPEPPLDESGDSEEARPPLDDSSMTPDFSIQTLYDEIYTAFDKNAYEDKIKMTYGSHDKNCEEGYGAFFSGPLNRGGYYIYGISYSQMICGEKKDGNTELDANDPYGDYAESAASHFAAWAEGLSDGYPIVIMSHVPLHARRGDNLGATRWFLAINQAALKHPIIFLWGHNHTGEKAQDTDSYLLVPGERITLQGAEKNETEEAELRFTYANAGYIKIDEGYASVVSFFWQGGRLSSFEIRRVSGDGSLPAEFGTTGKANPYRASFR